MKVTKLRDLLNEAIDKGYSNCDVVVTQDEHTYEINNTTLYDLGPGLFQIEVE